MKSILAPLATLLAAFGLGFGLLAQRAGVDPTGPVVTLTLTRPVDGESFALGAEIPLRATAVDTGGAITRLEFLADGHVIGVSEIFTLVAIPPGTPVEHGWMWKDAPFGRHELSVRAQGSASGIVVSAPIAIQVGQVKPIATLKVIRPAGGERLRAGQPTELVAEATDPRGLIETVEFFVNGTKVGTSVTQFCPPCEVEPCPLFPCALPPAGTTLNHRVQWTPGTSGEAVVEARTTLADGILLKSEPVGVLVQPPMPTVTVTTGRLFALEGDRFNRGEIVLERSGDLSRELTVFFEVSGLARRGADYRFVVDPCDDCARPDVELVGNSLTFPAGEAKVVLGVFAGWDGLLTVVEQPAESLRFQVYTPPIPAVVGAEPPYLAGTPNVAELFVVDRRSPGVAEVILVEPEPGAELALGAPHILWALAVDPAGSIRRVEFLAGSVVVGVSQILTRDADIPGRLRVHELTWRPSADFGPGALTLRARAVDAAGQLLESWPVPVKLTDPDAELPVLSVVPGKTPAYEAGDLKSRTASVVVRRAGGTDPMLALDFWLLVTGSATGGFDYSWTFDGFDSVVSLQVDGVFLPVTLPAGATQRELTLVAEADNIAEGTETVVVRVIESPLQTAIGGLLPVPPAYRIGEPASATVEIRDKVMEPASVTLTVDGTEFPTGATVKMSATAIVPGFGIGGIVFLADGQAIGQVPYCCDTCRCLPPVEGAPLSVTFAWTNPPAGLHRLTAQALTTGNNLWESEPVTIRVGDLTRPTLTIVAPTNGTILKVGSEVTIDTVGVDPRGLVNMVEFFANGLKIGETCLACVIDAVLQPGTPLHNQIVWKPVAPGSVVLTAVGHFTDGQKVAAPPVVVRVGELIVPSLTLTSPLNGATLRSGETVTVEAVGQHPAGWVTTVEFYANGGKIGEQCLACMVAGLIHPGQSLANRIEWKPVKPGAYVLTAVGLFSTGDKVTSVPVNVRVLDGQAGSLAIKSPADGAKLMSDAPVDVVVSGTGRMGGFTDVSLLVDGLPVAESHLRFIRAPGADEEVIHTFAVRLAAGTRELVAQDLTDRSVKSPPVRVLVQDSGPGPSFVRRMLPATYQVGTPFTVRLEATPRTEVAAWAVEEVPPFALATPGAAGVNEPRWSVIEVSDGGVFDPVKGKVKFGPYFDHTVRVLTYRIIPNLAVDLAEFSGIGSADGVATPITGDRLLRGNRRHPADIDPADDAISANELTAYAAAWKRDQPWPVAPNPIPMDYVTRAAALWKAGENYREVAVAGSARDWANGLPTAPADAAANVLPLAGTALRSRSQAPTPSGGVLVSYRVFPAPGSRAFALEETLPEGIEPGDISAGGVWSPVGRTLRWGPFFAGARPDISFAASADPGRLSGRVSFDGLSLPVHEAPPTPSPTTGRLMAVDPLPDGTVQISLEAEALTEGGEFDLEISADLSNWSPVGGFAPESSAGFVKDSGPSGAEVRFYRAVRRK